MQLLKYEPFEYCILQIKKKSVPEVKVQFSTYIICNKKNKNIRNKKLILTENGDFFHDLNI